MKKTVCTLCLLVRDEKILLGLKKTGFGMGKWNGFGGKVNAREKIKAAAVREIREECGIEALSLRKVGLLHFHWPERKPARLIETHIFSVDAFSGKILESSEMRPRWFHLSSIPYKKMWADDLEWLPLLLAGKKFKGEFYFGEKNKITRRRLRVVERVS